MVTFDANVVQFLRPGGKIRQVTTKLPLSVKSLYEAMIKKGCRLEAEVLTNGKVSVTVSDLKVDADIDGFVVDNGPEVQVNLIEMLERKSWTEERGVASD